MKWSTEKHLERLAPTKRTEGEIGMRVFPRRETKGSPSESIEGMTTISSLYHVFFMCNCWESKVRVRELSGRGKLESNQGGSLKI